ncbi:MAG: hypothetical protein OXI81_06365 [Paracoccaceae bacterium]|nr:hypothetical protein [Paracoccaceae bacterium]
MRKERGESAVEALSLQGIVGNGAKNMMKHSTRTMQKATIHG